MFDLYKEYNLKNLEISFSEYYSFLTYYPVGKSIIEDVCRVEIYGYMHVNHTNNINTAHLNTEYGMHRESLSFQQG